MIWIQQSPTGAWDLFHAVVGRIQTICVLHKENKRIIATADSFILHSDYTELSEDQRQGSIYSRVRGTGRVPDSDGLKLQRDRIRLGNKRLSIGVLRPLNLSYVEWLKGRQCSFTVNNIRAFHIAAVSWREKRNLDTTTAFIIWATTVLAGNTQCEFSRERKIATFGGKWTTRLSLYACSYYIFIKINYPFISQK